MVRNKKTKDPEYVSPYQRLQNQLAILIADAKPGDRLPAEPELAQQLGVSRATLREAMRSFEGQGLIRRRQGIGTFIVGAPHIIDTGLEVLESIETIAKRIGLDVSMGALDISHTLANEEQSSYLEIPHGSPLVRVQRVILASNRPVAYLEDTLPEDILTENDLNDGFTGSVLDLLLRRGTPALASSLTEIKAVAAPSGIARQLEIQRGDVLLQLVARLKTADNQVVDFSKSNFLPGYFNFRVVRRVVF